MNVPVSRDPFVGPVPFARDDKWRFFGRAAAAEEVFSLLLSSRALLLYAQSGAGKTSLIHAGLLPLVEEEGFDILPTARVQGVVPPAWDAQVVNPYSYFMLTSMGLGGRPGHASSLSEALGVRDRPDDAFGDPARRLVVLDQCEELFTAFPERWPERTPFVGSLAAALEDDPRLHIVMCLREDYLADMLSFAPCFPDRLRTRFRLQPLGLSEAHLAIEGPVLAAGRSFAPGVVDQLVKELALIRVQTRPGLTSEVPGEFVEPVQLQVVCSTLWRSLPPETERITAEHVQRFGDVTSALAAFYDDAVARTVRQTGVESSVIRDWFSTTLITPANTRSMAFRSTEATEGLPNAAVDVLEDLHMLRAESRAGGRWYELTHDRFIGPIQASNAAHKTHDRVSLWGVLPLGVAFVLSILVGVRGPHHGVAGIVLETLVGGLAALGGGQLLNGWARRVANREPSTGVTTSHRARTVVRWAFVAVGLITVLGATGFLLEAPNSGPSTPFSRYVSTLLPSVSITGAPSCGGSNLRVFVNGADPSFTDVQSIPDGSQQLLPPFARTWCMNEASSNVVGVEASFWLGLLAMVLPVMGMVRRRRRPAFSRAFSTAGTATSPPVATGPRAATRPPVTSSLPVAAPPPVATGPPAGWYPDPTRRARLRWWDGATWTQHSA